MNGGGRLPNLRAREVDPFLQHFSSSHTRKGIYVTGIARNGPFAFHVAHDGTLSRQVLGHVLRQMGVSRAEFLTWYPP